MRLRNTLILAVVFLALGAYVYFVELQKAADEAKKKTLVTFDTDQVTSVTLTYPDREIVLSKTDSGWRLSKPVDAPADETTVTNLLTAVSTCEVKKTLDDVPDNLAPFGLDQPQATVTLKLKDKEIPAIRVGKTSPVGNSTFVQRADEKKIYLTSSAFHSGMDKQVKDLRDKQILQFNDDDIRKISLMGGGRDVLLSKSDDSWTLEKPAGPYPADATAVRSLLSTLRSLRATDFPAEGDLGAYGLEQPRLTVTLVSGKDDNEQQILLGGESDKKELYLKLGNRPTVYTVGSYVFKDVDKNVNDLRDKTVLAFDKDEVTRVEVAQGDEKPFVLRRDKEEWTLDGATGQPDRTKITQFITDLHDLKGYSIASDRPDSDTQFGLSPPRLTITVHGKDDQTVGTARLGSYSPEANKTEYSAARAGSPTIFLVREYLYKRLDKKPADFVSAGTPTPAS